MYKRETIQSPLHKQSLQIKLFIKKVFHCYIMNQLFKKKRLKIVHYDNEKQTKHPIRHIMSFYDGRKKRWKKNENGNDHATMLSKQELRAKKKALHYI